MRGLVYIKPSPEGGDDKRGGADFRSTAKKQQCRNKGADVSFISEVVLGIRRRDRRLRFLPSGLLQLVGCQRIGPTACEPCI